MTTMLAHRHLRACFEPANVGRMGAEASLGLSGWCMAAYVFLLPVQIPVGADLRLAPSDVFVLVYLYLRLGRLTSPRLAWSVWHSVLLLSLLVGTVVTAAQGHLSFYVVVQKDLGILTLTAAYACIVDFCRDTARVVWLCRAFLWGVLVNLVVALGALYAAAAGVVNLTYINFDGVRLAGLLIDPNAFGGLLVTAIAVHFLTRAAGVYVIGDTAGRLLSMLLPVGLVLTFSRSAWMGAGLVFACGVWMHGFRLLRRLLLVGAALVVVAFFAASVVLPNAATLVNRQEQVDSRLSILASAFEDLTTSPLTGIGLGGSLDRHGVQIHNTTMFFLAELGPLGLLALLGFVGWYIARGDRLSRHGGPVVAGLGGAFLAAHLGMFGVSMGIDAFYQRHWWLVLGMIGALYAGAATHVPAPRSVLDSQRQEAEVHVQ
jgi:putative inorganic carbon (hco3(-)) transporter